MSMIEHAVGVVSLERFAEISHMSHDEMGSLLLDTMDENAKLRELLSMYMTFARVKACGHVVQFAHADGMGKVMDEAEMRERAMELGIEVDV